MSIKGPTPNNAQNKKKAPPLLSKTGILNSPLISNAFYLLTENEIEASFRQALTTEQTNKLAPNIIFIHSSSINIELLEYLEYHVGALNDDTLLIDGNLLKRIVMNIARAYYKLRRTIYKQGKTNPRYGKLLTIDFYL